MDDSTVNMQHLEDEPGNEANQLSVSVLMEWSNTLLTSTLQYRQIPQVAVNEVLLLQLRVHSLASLLNCLGDVLSKVPA